MVNVEKLKFTKEYFDKYASKRINIENGFLKPKKEDFRIIKIEKTNYGYQKAVVELEQPELCDLMNVWERQINEYLKDEGIPPIKILYDNKSYPKTHIRNGSTIKIKSVWINNENKSFPQLWLE